jgi:fido (protein-threonine AMPylation protein)
MVENPYCYPGSSVLRNKQDIRDAAELERFERLMVAQRMSEGLPQVEITPAGYRALHRHLFQDVYNGPARTGQSTSLGMAPFFEVLSRSAGSWKSASPRSMPRTICVV